MDGELSLEQLASKLDATLKIAGTLKADMDEMKKNHEGQEEDKKEEEAKKAQEDMEEEKKEARANRYKALKAAMNEHDEEKRDAAIKAAMDEHDHMEKDAQTTREENLLQQDKPHIEKKEGKYSQTEEEKEEHAAVASILKEKKADYISKILTANKIFNPSEVKEIQKRLKKANISELEKEWSHVKPFVANMPNQPQEKSEPFIPFFASMGNAEEIDAAQLNANSPDSAFAKLSTKELLEMAN